MTRQTTQEQTMTVLATTPRPAYTGPRTRFTTPDGTYALVVTFADADHVARYGAGTQETPRCAKACQVVTEALGRPATHVSGGAGYVGPLGRGFSALWVTLYFHAGSDQEAAEVFTAVGRATGARGGVVRYMEPNEMGGSSSDQTTVWEVQAA